MYACQLTNSLHLQRWRLVDKRENNRKDQGENPERSEGPTVGSISHNDREVTAPVRDKATARPKVPEPATRVLIRVDHFPTIGELDFSLVAWAHPEAALISNRIWSSYDKWHLGMAAPDIVAHLYTVLALQPDPFP